MSTKLVPLALVAGVAAAAAGCGEFIRQDRSSVTLIIDALEAASGGDESAEFAGTLQSDVLTDGSVFSDNGRVTMRLIMKDLAEVGTATNAVTITRYRVSFRRSDGRNTPGLDVPQPFDSAITFTVAPGGTSVAGFELIRHVAKLEAPLLALGNNPVIISTVADVSFIGRDQAGRDVSATGSIGVQFGNFADPD